MKALDEIPSNESLQKYKLKSVIYGAAVGDALGVPFEFKSRDSFSCTDMIGNGTHSMPTGTFSDDTSLLLATCKSIKECKKIDIEDMRNRFKAWLYRGEYTPDGIVFDVGSATAMALDQGYGCDAERSNGNGSLMRIAPLAFLATTDNEIRAVSAITHAHWISKEACVVFVGILQDLIDEELIQDAIVANTYNSKAFVQLQDIERLSREEIKSGGFVLDTLTAALWCVLNTNNYKDCVLTAVNLGGDTDTTACVAGALAGAMYGYDSIPAGWIKTLRGKDVIDDCLWL